MAFSIRRGEILRTICDNSPISVIELSRRVKISAGTTIYRYLKELEDRGLITMYKDSKKKRGNPTMIKATDKANPPTEFELNVMKKMFMF
jgi:predicted ArsR family transcriptional regulator